MSYRNPKEQGYKIPKDLRQGSGDTPPFQGINSEEDPGAISDAEFGLLENAWIGDTGRIIRNRGGQSKITASALTGCVEGIFDAGDSGVPQEAASDGPRLYGRTSTQIYAYDIDFVPPSQRIAPGATELPEGGFTLSGFLYLCGDTKGYRMATTNVLAGQSLVDLAPAPTELFTFPVNMSGIGNGDPRNASIRNLGTDLFFSVARVLANGGWRVYKWTGAVLTEDDNVTLSATSLATPAALGVLGTELFAGSRDNVVSTLNEIIRRRSGAGVWSDVALPAGVDSAKRPYVVGQMASFGGSLYIIGATQTGVGRTYILKWDGAALTVAREITEESTPVGADPGGLVVAGGNLYFLWHKSADGAHPRIGKYDGTTWTPTFKDLNAQFGSTDAQAHGLAVYDGELYLLLDGTGLVRTSSLDVAGTWISADNPAGLSLFRDFGPVL